MFKLRINDGVREFEVEGGRSLLATLADEGLWLPSICGGTTSCGECACVVDGKFDEASSVERAILGQARLARKMRLACSIVVASDVDLRVPDEVLSVRKRHARVAEVREPARDTREIVLESLDGTFSFRPGQYLRVFVPPLGAFTEAFQRAYSYASPPGDTRVSILVRRSPSGLASVWLHDVLSVGDTLEVVGPFGSFCLPPGEAPLICVAGGTGLAPFFPILDAAEDSGVLDRREIFLVFGAREEVEILGRTRLEELQKRWPRFHFVPVLQEAGESWEGARGLVTDVVAALLADVGEAAKGWQAALCGSPGMVKACERLLARHGIEGEAIRHDSFA